MKLLITSFITLFLLTTNVNSQDIFKNYKPIQSKGSIPEEFLIKSSDKVENEIEDFIAGEKGKSKKNKKDFLIKSTFSTQQILLSGKVLYNDPVTTYINKVAAEIFKANSDLDKNDFKIYAYKSPIVNAFAFNDGLVLVNIGLIAQLENEAQLALILSHEFTHVVNDDAIDLFLSDKDVDQGKGVYKNISYDDKMLYKSKYSQEKESTADLQGLEYFKNTKYSIKAVNGVFDVLKYAYLPFDDIPFDTTYFEKGSYIFPNSYTLNEINRISPDGFEDEDEDEEILKSHPGTEERREAVIEEITLKELKDKTRKIYLAGSEKEFYEIRNICRFEMPRMYLIYGYYTMAFYNVYLLEKQGFNDNIYLDKLKARILGQMARNINNGNRSSISKLKDIKEYIQGESQQLYYFLNSLSRKKKEFNVFAVEYTYEILKKYPKDEELKQMFSNILYEMYEETTIKFSSFKKTNIGGTFSEASVQNDTISDEKIENSLKEQEKIEKEKLMKAIRNEDSKYKTIDKKIKKVEEIEENSEIETKNKQTNYYKYAFVNFMNDKYFTKEAKKVEKKYKKESNKILSKNELKEKQKKEEKDRVRGKALGIGKIVVVNPISIVINNDKTDLYKTEKAQIEYNKLLKKLSKKAKLQIETIDINKLKSSDSDIFQNATTLNDWISEQFLFDESLEYSSIEKEKIDELINEYNTKYFLWTGVISIKNSKHTFIFNVLYNIETGKEVLRYFKDVNYSSSKTIIKSEVYHLFDQIKTERK